MRDKASGEEFIDSIRHLMNVPPMAAAEELRIILAWKADPEPRHVDVLIRANARLILQEIRPFWKSGADPADLFQEACLGLLHSLKGFDPSRGFRFTTYSIWWWRAYIRLYAMKSKSMVWHADKSSPPRDLGIADPEDLENGITTGCISLDHALRSAVPAADPEALYERREEWEAAVEAIASMTPREQQILGERFAEERTLKVVGTKLGISRERCRQIEAATLRKVRQKMGISVRKEVGYDHE